MLYHHSNLREHLNAPPQTLGALFSVVLPLPHLKTRCVSAGFPSPAEDYEEHPLDLNAYLITHPAATFMMRVKGHSMRQAGIFDGDLLLIDRSQTPQHKQIAVVVLNGAFCLKELRYEGKTLSLHSAHPQYPPRKIKAGDQCEVWGVVSHVIRSLR